MICVPDWQALLFVPVGAERHLARNSLQLHKHGSFSAVVSQLNHPNIGALYNISVALDPESPIPIPTPVKKRK